MANRNSQYYDVRITNPDGTVSIQGDILDRSKTLLTMRCKKPGSSSYERQVFSMENVLTIAGDVGKKSVIQIKGPQVIAYFPQAIIEPAENGFSKVIAEDADGKSLEVLVRSSWMTAVTPLSKDEAPNERLKHEKSMKPTDAIVTRRPKRELTEKQKVAAKKNLDKANAKNKDKKSKKRVRE